MLKRITSWSFQHRRLVVAAWIGILVAINFAAMTFGGENKQEFLSPGTDSKAAIDLLDERFPAQAGDTVSIVIHDEAGVTSAGVLAVAEPLVERVRELPHILAVSAPWDPGGSGQVSSDGTIGYAVVQLDSTSARFPVEVATEMIDLAADARLSGVQIELAGQAIDNAQSTSIGAEGPGLLARRHHSAGRVRVTRGDGSSARHRAVRCRCRTGRRRAARQLHRRARLGELGRDDDRPRRRHRLRAVDRHPLPQRARLRCHPDRGRVGRDGHRWAVGRLRRDHRRHLPARHADDEPAVRPRRRLLRGGHRARRDAGRTHAAPGAARVHRTQHRPAAAAVQAPVRRSRRTRLLVPVEPNHPTSPRRHRPRRSARPRRADRTRHRAAPRVPGRRQRPDESHHPPRLRPDDRRLRRRLQRHVRARRRQR